MVLVFIITNTVIITFELSKSWAAKYNWEIGKFSTARRRQSHTIPNFAAKIRLINKYIFSIRNISEKKSASYEENSPFFATFL